MTYRHWLPAHILVVASKSQHADCTNDKPATHLLLSLSHNAIAGSHPWSPGLVSLESGSRTSPQQQGVYAQVRVPVDCKVNAAHADSGVVFHCFGGLYKPSDSR